MLLGCILAGEIRHGVATRYGIAGENCCYACVTHTCCPSCSVLQMLRELSAHGEFPGTCWMDMDQPSPASMCFGAAAAPIPLPAAAPENPNARAPAWNASQQSSQQPPPGVAMSAAPPAIMYNPIAAGFYPPAMAQPAFAPPGYAPMPPQPIYYGGYPVQQQ